MKTQYVVDQNFQAKKEVKHSGFSWFLADTTLVHWLSEIWYNPCNDLAQIFSTIMAQKAHEHSYLFYQVLLFPRRTTGEKILTQKTHLNAQVQRIKQGISNLSFLSRRNPVIVKV